MAFCETCQLAEAEHSCGECHGLVCGTCSERCQVCEQVVCKKHIQVTSRGRRLCGACTARRNTKRSAMREQRRSEKHGASATAPPKPKPSQPEPASTSFSALGGGSGGGPAAGTSFSALTGEEASEAPPSTSFSTLASGEDDTVGTDVNASDVRKVHVSESLKQVDLDDPERKERLKEMMGVGEVAPGSTRLELGPIDENRPVLSSSGYQPPPMWKYLVAYIAFAIGVYAFFRASPDFRELLLPWDTPELDYYEGQIAPIQSTNAIRAPGHISQFEIFSQGPFFLIAWVFVLLFGIGGLYVTWGTLSSFYWSFRLWRSERKARKHDPNDNIHANL